MKKHNVAILRFRKIIEIQRNKVPKAQKGIKKARKMRRIEEISFAQSEIRKNNIRLMKCILVSNVN